MPLVTASLLSSSLKGEAADWLIRCRPVGRSWQYVRSEFPSVFTKPRDFLEEFAEAVNGRRNPPPGATLLDEGMHAAQLALSLIKNREGDESLATLFACHVVSGSNEFLKR